MARLATALTVCVGSMVFPAMASSLAVAPEASKLHL